MDLGDVDKAYAKTDMDDHLSLSIDFKGDVKCITYQPPVEDFDPSWERQALNKWKQYLLIDPLTSEGKRAISVYHGMKMNGNH